MKIEETRVIELLRENDDFLILTHKNPDGDTLGCGVALTHALRQIGKRANVINGDVIPSRYDFLFEGLEPQDFSEKFIIAVDVADTKLLGSALEEKYGTKVDLCIDHHGSNIDYAKELFLRADDGAASLTLYRILKDMGIEMTKPIATALYTGISTDTGCFRYSNTSAEAMRVAADLMELGANNAMINVLMFETKSMSYFAMLGEVLATMRTFFDGKVIVFKVTNEMFEKTGATPDQCDAIAAMSRQFEGALCGITMKQKPNGAYKFSLRTHDPLDAAKLCGALGGGGHMRAAGCDATDEEEALKVLLGLIEEELK